MNLANQCGRQTGRDRQKQAEKDERTDLYLRTYTLEFFFKTQDYVIPTVHLIHYIEGF